MAAPGVIERLFRWSTGPILAEDCLADAVELALRAWPVSGVPANPRGWLFRVAATGQSMSSAVSGVDGRPGRRTGFREVLHRICG
jgi:predicted RNA polymerase sigma factor